LPPCPTTTAAPTTTAPPAAPAPDPAPLGLEIPAELEAILFTIRLIESGHRYDVPPNRGNASGAYQYIASTWNGHAGYPHAYLAPPEVQDARAASDVQAILATWKGDVSMVPVIWYYPRAAREPALMDQVPVPQAGNRLTVREYQHRWLDVLAYITGNPVTYRASAVPPNLEFLSGRPPELSVSLAELLDVAFPVLGGAVIAPPVPCAGDGCEPGTSAIVYGQKLQPIVAVATGIVTAVDEDHVTGALTVTITDALGRTYVYAGFNDDSPGSDDGDAPASLRLTSLAQVGTTVRTGQIIGFMGDTDPMPVDDLRGVGDAPVWPHLRLTIRNAEGVRIDTDLLVNAAQQRQACHVAIGPWSVPEDPDADHVDVADDAIMTGGWTIHDDGTVTAFGRSALILPPQGCVWAPQEPYGPGAAGADPDDDWDAPVELPAKFWVSGVGAIGFGRGLTHVP
jgi:hypothetical protein